MYIWMIFVKIKSPAQTQSYFRMVNGCTYKKDRIVSTSSVKGRVNESCNTLWVAMGVFQNNANLHSLCSRKLNCRNQCAVHKAVSSQQLESLIRIGVGYNIFWGNHLPRQQLFLWKLFSHTSQVPIFQLYVRMIHSSLQISSKRRESIAIFGQLMARSPPYIISILKTGSSHCQLRF